MFSSHCFPKLKSTRSQIYFKNSVVVVVNLLFIIKMLHINKGILRDTYMIFKIITKLASTALADTEITSVLEKSCVHPFVSDSTPPIHVILMFLIIIYLLSFIVLSSMHVFLKYILSLPSFELYLNRIFLHTFVSHFFC